MKIVSQLLALTILLSLTVACGSNSNKEKAATVASEEKTLDLKANRGSNAVQAIDRFSAGDINIDLETLETFTLQSEGTASADEMKLLRVNQSLMAAEKEAQVLNVNFSMSDEPVKNGMFVFSIESPDNKEVVLEMFDEEGYNLAANNSFLLNEGNNYKALNVNTLDNGEYLFRLKDDQGRELARTVSIDHEEQF
jgi:hypothetical protein